MDNSSRNKAKHSMVVADLSMKKIITVCEKVALSQATVLLIGESGTGKEVLAHHIHQHSDRKDQAFLAINCAAIPDNMLEATLFGYEKGAFTGAYLPRPGKFEDAQNGTLFLDEITEIPLMLQAKLLRVLQEKEVERLGGRKTIFLNVRIIVACNKNLFEEVQAGRFREDLYYRLNVFPVLIPALNQRVADILPLAEFFLQRYKSNSGEEVKLSKQAQNFLLSYAWPGNVRELENFMQRALLLKHEETIYPEDFILNEGGMQAASLFSSVCMVKKTCDESSLEAWQERSEHDLIQKTLLETQGSRIKAAFKLGISPRTLRYKLARFREKEQFGSHTSRLIKSGTQGENL